MNEQKRDEDNGDYRPFDDIIEGVDAIGTIIDQELPTLAGELEHIRSRIDDLAGSMPRSQPKTQLDGFDPAELVDRIDLIDQRLIANEQIESDRFSGIVDELSKVNSSLSDLHDKLDAITAWIENEGL
jgi:hypothetical protein